MTTVTTPPTTAPPDPVRAALDDPTTRIELMNQVVCRLKKWLSDHSHTRRQQEAEDIVAEVLVRAWANRTQFDSSIATVPAWLHGIACRVTSEHCRRLRKQPPSDSLDRCEAPDDRDDGDPLEFLNLLGTDERQIVEWHLIHAISHSDIAGRLNISEGNARLRYHRALTKLRTLARVQQEGER